uniref:Uncharacterized protein n=1 Tax=Lepeophtheirus salmonis TaxID=72036 RepID=A0A0K2UDZ9_LEPSM
MKVNGRSHYVEKVKTCSIMEWERRPRSRSRV